MKKIFCILITTLFLISCSNSSNSALSGISLSPSIKVLQEIDRMNHLSSSDYQNEPVKRETEFSNLIHDYNELSQSEKDEITNADQLSQIGANIIKGWKSYKAITVTKACIGSVKDTLLNPSSYIQNKIFLNVTMFNNEVCILVVDTDYSFQIKEGGYDRKKESYCFYWIQSASTYAHEGHWEPCTVSDMNALITGATKIEEESFEVPFSKS